MRKKSKDGGFKSKDGEDEPILTEIFFRSVDSTTNQKSNDGGDCYLVGG